MNYRIIAALLLFLFLEAMIPTGILAQDKTSPPQPTANLARESLAQADAKAEAAADERAGDGKTASVNADQEQSDYNREYWKFQLDVLNHSRKVYSWQHTSSIIIFYVVIFMVLMGVLFSWLQFKSASFKSESQELDASMQGVKITSSTLGVVILVLSMCFFYLYLRYVYPVNVTESGSATDLPARRPIE